MNGNEKKMRSQLNSANLHRQTEGGEQCSSDEGLFESLSERLTDGRLEVLDAEGAEGVGQEAGAVDGGGVAAGHLGGGGRLPEQRSEVWLGGAGAEFQTGTYGGL